MRAVRTICMLLMALSTTALAGNSPELMSVNLSSSTVIGGNELHGTVTLNSAAPYDLQVSLAADPANAAKVPATVIVPAGSKDASFAISTLRSAAGVLTPDAVVTVYGNYGVTKSGSFTVVPPVSFDQMIDRVVERERSFVASMKSMHPLAETYIQDLKEDKNHNIEPVNDHYFLGRLDFSHGPQDELFQNQHANSIPSFLNMFSALFTHRFLPRGFAQMVMLDADFQKSNYDFTYVRQEFLGQARCFVMDVQPKQKAPSGLFTGRIWVEDREFNIVRFNGTYSARSRYTYYLHFDSWRLNVQPHVWLPAYIYIEESGTKLKNPPFHTLDFKAQTRLWAYDPEALKHEDQFTDIKVDSSVNDDASADKSPLEAQRLWERMAEDNAVDHLQKIGLLAPRGEVDKVLQTVANNLIVTNQLEIAPNVRCRVLLTTPLESFTIGHTIVVSRGLLDVLPDEASLAMVIAHELGHIALGHRLNTNLAFTDRFFFPDLDTFQHLDFARSPADEEAADKKGMELLASSPYKDKLASAGLFLKALQDHAALSNLIKPHMGNRMRNHENMRMAALLSTAPVLAKQRIDQIAALPMGSRIKLDPWSDELKMMKVEPVALLSPHDKMPFEVTPFFPYVSYSASDNQGEIAQNAAKP